MAAPRKNPPPFAAETIYRLASEGYSRVGLAKHFNVSRDTLNRWLSDDETLEEAFEFGRETERQALHAAIVAAAKAGKPANVNAFFVLKSRHGYVEADNKSNQVNVAVDMRPVLVVPTHGSDEQWAARAAAQQAALVAEASAPVAPLILSNPVPAAQVAYLGPPRFIEPQTTSVAPSWKGSE